MMRLALELLGWVLLAVLILWLYWLHPPAFLAPADEPASKPRHGLVWFGEAPS